MVDPAGPLPEFSSPPVAEVVLGVQFEPLERLSSPHMGLLWSRIRQRFPRVEEKPPLAPVVERFDERVPAAAAFQFELVTAPPPPRWWFLNEAGTEFLQVQRDRFLHNWRRLGPNDEYPRYRQLRETFRAEFADFCDFVAQEQLGDVAPNQCELTYVNQITSSAGWERHGQLGRVFTFWSEPPVGTFLPEPEDVRVVARYVIPDAAGSPIGRLYAEVTPAYRIEDNRPVFVLNLTARGRPAAPNADAVFNFLDVGHIWAVRGFDALTTPQMHAAWGRHDGQ